MESAPAVPRGAVHALLRQLVQSCFVLTDRDGAVTRWSGPAHAFFGWDPHAMLGRPLLQTLGVAAEPPEHGGRITSPVRLRGGRTVDAELVFIPVRMNHSLEFNGFLSALEQMSVDALSVERLRSGHYGVVDWIEASMVGEGKLAEDEQTAGTIVTFRALDGSHEQYVYDTPGDEFDDFEPLVDDPDVPSALDEATAAREQAAAATARVEELEAEGKQLRDELQETRTLVDGLGSRLEQDSAAQDLRAELEQTQALVESLRTQLAEVPATDALIERLRQELAGAEALAQTREAVDELRARLEDSASGSAIDDLRARVDDVDAAALREQLEQLREQVEGGGAKKLRRELEQLRAEFEQRGADDKLQRELQQLRERVEGFDAVALREDIERLRGWFEDAGENGGPGADTLRELMGEVEGRLGRVEEAAARAGAHAETTRALAERGEQQAERLGEAEAAVRTQAAGVREAADAVVREVDRAAQAAADAAGHADLAREAGTIIEQHAVRAEQAASAAEGALTDVQEAAQRSERAAESVDARVAELQQLAAQATQRAEAAEAALEATNEALERTAERAEQAAAAAADHLAEARIAAEQAGLEAEMARVEAERGAGRRSAEATRRPRREPVEDGDPRAPLFGRKRDTGPDREPRPGFDDTDQPMATIALDGHFDELNKAFSELVGYSEQDFRQASWPPVMDRKNLEKHREQMRALQAGELAEADVNTGYVHAQGLLVPVVGTLTLEVTDGGPDRFLLTVKRP